MNQPLLIFLATQNYKNLSSDDLDSAIELKNLNVFIGSNGSGKSNFINCLIFLKDCLTKIPDQNRGVSSFQDAVSKIGADRILDNSVESPAVVKLNYHFSLISQNGKTHIDNITLELKIYVDRKKNSVRIVDEILLGGKSDKLYSYSRKKELCSVLVEGIPDLEDKYEEFNKISNKSLVFAELSQILEKSKYPPEKIPVYKIRRDLVDFISQWQFYNANNMDLHKIRTSEPKIGGTTIYLSPSGDNLPLVLENLIAQDIEFEDIINQAMKSIFPKTRRLRPIRSGRLSLTIEWYFQDMEEPFYLSEMSDGTVRMLCWATILHSPELPSLLVIDEPELGLHVSWMRILGEWIKRAARKTQIIVTTHSPDLLDHFTDCLENVYCFATKDTQHFQMKKLSEEMLSSKLEEGWELGDLYRVGDPSIGGWPW
jgi:predicted ATPase